MFRNLCLKKINQEIFHSVSERKWDEGTEYCGDNVWCGQTLIKHCAHVISFNFHNKLAKKNYFLHEMLREARLLA